jgi:hypothetical protein
MTVRTDPASLRFSNKKPTGPLDDQEIAAFLHRKIEHALNRDDGEISEVREKHLARYRGDSIGDEREGFSKFRTREVYEMVEGAIPGILAVFFSSKHPIQFQPQNPNDVDAAKHETAIIDHNVFRRPNSFLKAHDITKSAFIDPVAYTEVDCNHVERSVHHKYAELSAAQLLKLTESGREWQKGLKIETITEPGVEEELYSFEGEEIVMDPEFYIDPVPPEQMLIEQQATNLDLDEVWERYGFIGRRYEATFTDLVLQGFDPDELNESGGSNVDVRFNDERSHRMDREDERPDNNVESDYSTRLFTVYKCYIKMDCDGTGLAQSWRITMVGNTIFEKEKTSYQPFIATSLIPMPFKHAGLSPVEGMQDLQELKTKLMRIILDDAYRNETRRTYVDKNGLTIKGKMQMANPLSSEVETKGRPADVIMPEPQFTNIEKTLAVAQYADDTVKRRTGMAPDVFLNPDVLKDATAHGLLGAGDKTSSRLMHYSRILAETLWKKIGVKMHQLHRMYMDRRKWVQINDEWLEYNPADWQERTEMKVAVGLGFNSKEQTLQALMQLLALQKEALTQGLATPMHLKHTLDMIIEYADVGFYSQFFVDPDPKKGWKPPPPPPNPQMEAVKVQAEATKQQEETKRMEAQLTAKAAEGKLEVERMKVEVDAGRIEADAALKNAQAATEAALVVEKRQAEVEALQAERAKTLKEIEKLTAEINRLNADATKLRADARAAEKTDGPEAIDSQSKKDDS